MSVDHRMVACVATMTLVFTVGAASADEPSSSPLTMAELLAAVRGHNPAVAARRQSASAAAIKPRAEGLPDDPMVTLEWWQQPVDFSTVPLMITYRQPIPYLKTLRLQREVAERESRIVRDDADETERQIIADARRAYYDLAFAEESLDLNDRVRVIDQHLVAVADALYRVGKSVQSDVFKAQADLLLIENERLDQERMRDEAHARLNALLDRPSDSPLGRAADPASIVALPSERDLVERALSNRPEVVRARDAHAAAESRARLAERARLPELAAWSGAMVNLGGTSTFTLGVSATLPIFSSQRASSRVEAATLEAGAARHDMDAARRNTELAVHAAMLQIEAAQRHVRLHAEKLVPLAELTYSSAEASYQAGRADFPSVLDAARMVRDHHFNHVRYLVEYRRRLADLEQLVGDLDEQGARP